MRVYEDVLRECLDVELDVELDVSVFYSLYGMVWYQIRVNPGEDKEALAAFLVINPF